MQHNIFATMRSLKLYDGCRSTQVYAVDPAGPAPPSNGVEKLLQHLPDQFRAKPNRSRSSWSSFQNQPTQHASFVQHETLLPYGLPLADAIEPQVEPCLKSVNFVETLADMYRRIENCPQFEKSEVYIEQCAIFRSFCDPKLFRRSLRSAREHAVDVNTKVVLAAWLRYERREDELIGSSSMDCCGRNLECPKASLISGYDPESVYDSCICTQVSREETDEDEEIGVEERDEDEDAEIETDEDGGIGAEECSTSMEEDDMSFCIGDEEIRCCRASMASLSRPFETMLYGGFMESRKEIVNFSRNEISVKE